MDKDWVTKVVAPVLYLCASLLSKCRRKLQRQNNKNWLEPAGPKMAEDLTPVGREPH